jgi:hypothetical protein
MPPIHHDHVSVAGRDKRVSESHPGRACAYDQIVSLDPGMAHECTDACQASQRVVIGASY